MSDTSSFITEELSDKIRNAVLIGGVIVVGGLLLWVKDLRTTIDLRNDTIGTLKSLNQELTNSNTTLRSDLTEEKEATKQEAARSAALQAQLNSNLGKYNHAVQNDSCANTAVPSDVISSLQ